MAWGASHAMAGQPVPAGMAAALMRGSGVRTPHTERWAVLPVSLCLPHICIWYIPARAHPLAVPA